MTKTHIHSIQLYADSDDGDGRLNRHKYYKFMCKLNYDRSSYASKIKIMGLINH